MKVQNYNPDVLTCLANLSNDEVFTPPSVVNKMLDMLPSEIWSNAEAKFLDPMCKTGVFLREIAKRLMVGLEEQIPDIQERANHIFTKQLFGLAITELTALMSRRSVYCSKNANSKHSLCTLFEDEQGNIRYEKTKHSWQNGRCKYCGASQDVYDRDEELETYAYKFIHTDNPQNLFPNMKFDVIIGNPPYQQSFGLEGGNSSNAKSIYNLFIEQAINLSSRYLVMITPSRWMTKTAQGIPEDWVNKMLDSNHFIEMHDFEDANKCFPGVSIKGGVNYFLYDKYYIGKCKYNYYEKQSDLPIIREDYLDSKKAGIVIRDPKAYSIIDKIANKKGNYYEKMEDNFSNYVSPKHFFDDSNFLTSNWHDYKDEKDSKFNIKYYLNLNRERTYKWISLEQLPKNKDVKDLHKVIIPAAGGSGNDDIILGKPTYSEPNSVCSQTFLVIGYKHHLSKLECDNIITYIKTRFFRYLISIKKKTQNGPRGVYQFVPIQDFNEEWTDEKLYAKYGLDETEIAFIESMIRPME